MSPIPTFLPPIFKTHPQSVQSTRNRPATSEPVWTPVSPAAALATHAPSAVVPYARGMARATPHSTSLKNIPSAEMPSKTHIGIFLSKLVRPFPKFYKYFLTYSDPIFSGVPSPRKPFHIIHLSSCLAGTLCPPAPIVSQFYDQNYHLTHRSDMLQTLVAAARRLASTTDAPTRTARPHTRLYPVLHTHAPRSPRLICGACLSISDSQCLHMFSNFSANDIFLLDSIAMDFFLTPQALRSKYRCYSWMSLANVGVDAQTAQFSIRTIPPQPPASTAPHPGPCTPRRRLWSPPPDH